MHDPRISLERHQLRDVARAGLADPRDVVAGEVDQHHVLGRLLLVEAQVGLHAGRPRRRSAPRGRVPAIGFTSTIGLPPSRVTPDRRFRRSAEQDEVVPGNEEHVGAAVESHGRARTPKRVGDRVR